MTRRVAMARLAMLAAVLFVPATSLAADPPEFMRLARAADYHTWMKQHGWEDLRPFSNSAKRFRIESGALRMESQDDSFLIGSKVPGILPLPIDAYPYLRFVVRIDRAPERPDEPPHELADSALRVYAALGDDPPRSVAYAWTWVQPAGQWSVQPSSVFGDFGDVRHKSIGRGPPPAGRWLTVEANLREDVRTQFPMLERPMLLGISLKTDSNDSRNGQSLAWVRAVSVHRESLRAQGLQEGDAIGDTVLWYR